MKNEKMFSINKIKKRKQTKIFLFPIGCFLSKGEEYFSCWKMRLLHVSKRKKKKRMIMIKILPTPRNIMLDCLPFTVRKISFKILGTCIDALCIFSLRQNVTQGHFFLWSKAGLNSEFVLLLFFFYRLAPCLNFFLNF